MTKREIHRQTRTGQQFDFSELQIPADVGLQIRRALGMLSEGASTPSKDELLFSGTVSAKLDGKNRLKIPSEWAKELASGDQVAELAWIRAPDSCLWLLTHQDWLRLRLGLAGLNPTQDTAQSVERLFMRISYPRRHLDEQKRCLIPPELVRIVTEADSDRQVILTGCGRYLEIWNPEKFKQSFTHVKLDVGSEE